ncbi:chromate resistance protein [Pseudomonas aeruginosa]|uniref:Chromate resistance protein n=1 Tax=Pseudomonas aeruginosa TaxID=287 RepID=A0AAQ3LJR8_PSEAI|nr:MULTISPECIES: chromate resistance protein [Pseudomonadota]EIU4788362.1 chromate resistance protein [Pseudomonas aeruginosa]EKX4382973.1 chromate resistance protein [Pseudomonas aeruginosa]MCT9015379.1 chromate resistance protein [Cupriavidus gilardii]MCT9055149.1 chromate resistance protein [Cupriavidus gilardii]MDY7065049.1 Protein ChrB [Pseudomonas extremaustralis]
MTQTSAPWLTLIVSLPSASATARMRIWRAVKALGCAALRDGAYLLPAQVEQAAQLQVLADEVLQEGGQAWLLQVQVRDMAEQATFQALFDRTADYAPWLEELAQARQTFSDLGATELQRLHRKHARAYDAIRKIDFFPGETSIRAEAQWRDFANAIEAVQSPGEPQAKAGRIARRDRMQYQGRLWATRRHLWVDRVASAWLIQRFIDPHARFLWLDSPADCPPDALGFDFDGATFSHVGESVTFEVLLASFGLDGDRALSRLGDMVHALDVGGMTTPEASGFEAVLAGARKRWPDDDTLLADIGGVLDSLHAHFSSPRKP